MLGEVASSKHISGDHGEYDLTKGHFVCMDPYPEDAETAQEELFNAVSFMQMIQAEGFPFKL